MNRLLDRLERKCRGRYIENLMLYIVLGMAAVFLLDWVRPTLGIGARLSLDMAAVARGEVWRLVTFLLLPPSSSILWAFFALYFYYFIGSALEQQWGGFRFCVFYLVGALCCIVAALFTGYGMNTYLNLSLFLAFALVYPNYQLLLFFLLPVKVKYLAIAAAALLALLFVTGGWPTRISILLALVNIALFFGGDAKRALTDWKRRRDWRRMQRK